MENTQDLSLFFYSVPSNKYSIGVPKLMIDPSAWPGMICMTDPMPGPGSSFPS